MSVIPAEPLSVHVWQYLKEKDSCLVDPSCIIFHQHFSPNPQKRLSAPYSQAQHIRGRTSARPKPIYFEEGSLLSVLHSSSTKKTLNENLELSCIGLEVWGQRTDTMYSA